MHLGDKLWPKYAFESFEKRKKSISFCIYFVLRISGYGEFTLFRNKRFMLDEMT